ncbi:hypothetical protein E2C01_011835 [Portunus trituberculatus]|uniref:Uncharacterized protein n=1 Tax=Portunus trituberculatus TaxID=210409 RepID=A0A5B7DCX1_PORTR|nr:hypothetical protein [Portunus trituberculatus]
MGGKLSRIGCVFSLLLSTSTTHGCLQFPKKDIIKLKLLKTCALLYLAVECIIMLNCHLD